MRICSSGRYVVVAHNVVHKRVGSTSESAPFQVFRDTLI
jgi:hypothetical protein